MADKTETTKNTLFARVKEHPVVVCLSIIFAVLIGIDQLSSLSILQPAFEFLKKPVEMPIAYPIIAVLCFIVLLILYLRDKLAKERFIPGRISHGGVDWVYSYSRKRGSLIDDPEPYCPDCGIRMVTNRNANLNQPINRDHHVHCPRCDKKQGFDKRKTVIVDEVKSLAMDNLRRLGYIHQ